jgi:hypothetical protein
MADLGCLAGLYNEVFPFDDDEGGLPPLRSEERAAYLQRFRRISADAPLLMLEMRTAEAGRYGCRARKGTSCHIDAVTGKVSPCVVFPYSAADCVLERGSADGFERNGLERALRTPFFQEYRRGYERIGHCGTGIGQELQRLLDNPFLCEDDRGSIRGRISRLAPAPGNSNRDEDPCCPGRGRSAGSSEAALPSRR